MILVLFRVASHYNMTPDLGFYCLISRTRDFYNLMPSVWQYSKLTLLVSVTLICLGHDSNVFLYRHTSFRFVKIIFTK